MKAFFAEAVHPSLHRPYTSCGYTPMVELLRYLEYHGFTSYIASGGGRDFMRPVTTQMYGIPPERVIGSSVGLDFTDGHLLTTSRPEFLNDGPVKAVPDLGSHRATAHLRGGKLQRRHRNASVHRRRHRARR